LFCLVTADICLPIYVSQLRKIQYKIKHFEELESIMDQEYTAIQEIKGSLINEWLKVLGQAIQAGVSLRRDEVLMKLFLNKPTS
jgi:SWI/SNF related-matrix-associated actin-dependent regulator of chromatin subfamily C